MSGRLLGGIGAIPPPVAAGQAASIANALRQALQESPRGMRYADPFRPSVWVLPQ
jgi:hypothetical protein